MTEAEWLACNHPAPMLKFLGRTVSQRKLRLFAVACCRRVLHCFGQERSREAIDVAERFADDRATPVELRAAALAAAEATFELANPQDSRWPADPNPDLPAQLLCEAAEMTCWPTIGGAGVWGAEGGHSAWEAVALGMEAAGRGGEWENQSALLRDLFVNPFHPASIDPAWQTSAVVSLARTMYEEREFAPMPVLADALEEAGCDDVGILAHCRSHATHVRGCWVVDGVLGKG